MGTFKPEFVIGIVIYDPDKTKDLDRFVEEHSRLFTKSEELTNGFVNYVMFWDGSKEWWNASNEADRLREIFIELLKQVGGTTIYHIEDYEDSDPTVSRFFVYTKDRRVSESG